MKLRRHCKRMEDLFANLPSEIIIQILARLPIRSIISCKIVCKWWLALIETLEFVNSHLCKPVRGLVLLEKKRHTVYEFKDGLDLENKRLRSSLVIKFSMPYGYMCPTRSAKGLLLHYRWYPLTLYVSNPITREYIQPGPGLPQEKLAALGFGATKISGQHKVVTIFQDKHPKSACNCYVYTIGAGAWKKMAPPAGYLDHCGITGGVFLNGNLHWLVSNLMASHAWISCFDLENETFSTFSFPPMPGRNEQDVLCCALGSTLCLYHVGDNVTAIWLMMEYGVEESWTKQFVILDGSLYYSFHPIEVFKDGEILMGWSRNYSVFYYSNKTRSICTCKMFDSFSDTIPFLHTPNFLSLKRFHWENVISF